MATAKIWLPRRVGAGRGDGARVRTRIGRSALSFLLRLRTHPPPRVGAPTDRLPP